MNSMNNEAFEGVCHIIVIIIFMKNENNLLPKRKPERKKHVKKCAFRTRSPQQTAYMYNCIQPFTANVQYKTT